MIQTAWRCPSNIALVKYWGKFGIQLPKNPSLSLTLNEAHTTMTISANETNTGKVSTYFLFEGKENPKFKEKIDAFLHAHLLDFPFLNDFELHISSQNSFPHSAGIASSASSMGALALCLVDLEQQIKKQILSETDFLKKSSHYARLASGSACRSLFSGAAVWGKNNVLPESTNESANQIEINPIFTNYRDSILIVNADEKAVSSRAGHALMNNNPFANTRYEVANQNFERLYKVMQNGDLTSFIEIVEEEALMLHALMMMSRPSFILLHPNTLEIINRLRAYRHETKIPLCFTLDAGPNVHLLYPDEFHAQINLWLEDEIIGLCENRKIIYDKVGKGANKIKFEQV